MAKRKRVDTDKFYDMVLRFFAEDRKKEAEEREQLAKTPQKVDETKKKKPIIDENK